MNNYPVFLIYNASVFWEDVRPYHILLSCGMNALPMKVPEDIDSSPYAEVMILLPKEWNLDYDSFEDERNYWPIRLMKELMILPHPDETWLGFGHTFGHEDDEEFAEGIRFNSVMLAHSMELSDDFTQIEHDSNEVVTIFTLIPLYKKELEFKKKMAPPHCWNALTNLGLKKSQKSWQTKCLYLSILRKSVRMLVTLSSVEL